MARRLPELALAALGALALVSWLGALVNARPPKSPVVVVQGEPRVPTGAPLALRFSAVFPDAAGQSATTGVVRVGQSTASITSNTARIVLANPGAAGDPRAGVEIDALIDGRARVRGHVDARRTSISLGPPKLMFAFWRSEIQSFAQGQPRPRTAVYPIDGQVSGRLPSRVLVVDGDVVTPIDTTPREQGALVGDGRVLRVDRTGLQIKAPLECEREIAVEITSAETRTVGLDLIVDGAVHDAKNVALDAQGGASARATVTLALGEGAAPGDVVVVHAGGAWPDEIGRFALSRVKDPGKPLGPWVLETAHQAGAPDDDPLVAFLRAHPDHEEAQRALLHRLKPAKLRAPKLALVVDPPPDTARAFTTGYWACAALLVVGLALLGIVRMRERRWLALAAVLAVAAVLGGLGAALLVLRG